MDINVLGALNVLKFAKRCENVKIIVHVSTGQFLDFLIKGPYVIYLWKNKCGILIFILYFFVFHFI